MKPCIYPKKIPVVNTKQGGNCHLLVCLEKGSWVCDCSCREKKKEKEKSEVSMRPRDTGSVVAIYFLFLL